MKREEIIQKVRIKCDEISPFENKNPLNNILTDEFLDSSVTDLYMLLPTYMINATTIPSPKTLTGTVSVTINLAAVTGVGTKFTSEMRVGDLMTISGEEIAVQSIETDLKLTLGSNHSSGASGVAATVKKLFYTSGEWTGYIHLPLNFLKLVYFKMTEWFRPVTEAITVTDPKYILQQNEHTRGGLAKPIIAIRSDNYYKVLEYYSTTHPSIEKALYIGTDLAENVQADLIETLTWMISSNVFQVLEKHKESELAKNKILAFIQSRNA